MNDILPLILLTVVALTNLVLALLVFTNNPKSATNRLFSLLNLILLIWLVLNNLTLNPMFLSLSLILIRFTIFYAVLISLLFYLLSITIPKKSIPLSKKKLSLVLAVASVTMLITISPLAFTGLNIVNNSPQPIPGPGMLAFSIVSTVFSALAVVTLFKRINKSSGIEKEQLLYFAFGILTMLGAIILTVLIPVLFYKQNLFVSLLPIYTIFFLAPTTYAIVKHRLMDIRMVVTKTVSFTLLITFIAVFYAFAFARLTSIIKLDSSGFGANLISTLFLLIMILFFQPMKKFIEKLTDKIFYRDHYSTNILLHTLARIMAGTYDLNTLSQQLLKELTTQMKLSKGLLVLIDDNKITHMISENATNLTLPDSGQFIKLFNEDRTLLYEDLTDEEDKNLMRSFELGFIAILKNADKKIGLVCFGYKLSGDTFNNDDIRVLETFSSEAAVAVQNALAIEHTQKFNLILQEEVAKATKDLQNANSRLMVLDKLKDEFVSLASHELRTPMTAIKSYLWLFLQSKDISINEKQRTYIDRAYQATDRLIALVNDMLNISRIESGRMNIQIKPFSLKALITEVVEELKPQALKQQVTLAFNSNEELPEVLADQNKIREVIINLIGNSLKFTYPGGSINVGIFLENEKVVTKVTDTGRGINKEDLSKLFQKFQTVGGNYMTKMNSQGTGLGLYLCKSIIEMHGGKIWAKSEGEGKGSTFFFSLNTNTNSQAQVQPLDANPSIQQ